MSEVIRKSFKLLNAIKPKGDKIEYSATEISRELDIPVQTVHRLLSSLEESRIVFKNKETKKFRLGLNLLQIGISVRDNLFVRNSAIPIMEKLANKTKQSVYLTVPEGDEGVFVDSISFFPWLKEAEPVGMRVPLCKGASQKIILATMNYKSQQSIIQSLKKRGEITDISTLKAELKQIGVNRVAISYEEITKGTASVACPIFSWEDQVIASITINGPKDMFQGQHLIGAIESVQRAAQEISTELGWIESLSKFR